MFLSIGCDDTSVLRVILFIKSLLDIVFILVPIGLILILSIDLAKNVITKEDDMNKNVKIIIKRILFCVLIFFIKPIVSLSINLVENNASIDFLTCYDLATFNYIKDVNLLEKERDEVEREQRLLAQQAAILNNRSNFNNSGSSSSNNYKPDSKVIKVLMVGNSLTYMNGYGEILTRMAKKTNKSIVIVNAVKGGKPGQGRNLLKNTLEYKCWSANTNSCSSQNGHAKLTKIIDIDFAKQGRKSWDYIFLQNWRPSESSIIDSDTAIYNKVKRNLISSKGFVVNFNRQSSSKRSAHLKVMKDVGGSLVDTWHILMKYPKYKNALLLHDNAKHQKASGAYLYACVVYAKLYGKDNLANSSNSNSFIEVYGSDSLSSFHPKPKTGRKQVSKKQAKEMQALVYKYYNKYVLFY